MLSRSQYVDYAITGRKVEPNPPMSNRTEHSKSVSFPFLLGRRIVRGADGGADKGKTEKANAAL